MKLSVVIVVVTITVLALTTVLVPPINAALQDQDQPATTSGSDQPTLQTWKDPSIVEDLKNIDFDFDSHDLASEQLSLDANAQWLKSHPSVRIRLSGFTDPRGDIVYNLALSHRRAETSSGSWSEWVLPRIASSTQLAGASCTRTVWNRRRSAGS